MSKRKVTQDEIAALTEHPSVDVKLGGSLVERARTAAFMNAPSSICPLLNELAGEVERLWEVEKHISMVESDAVEARLRYSARLAAMEVEKDAEIDRIKSTVDTTAIQNAFYRGFMAAAKQLTSVINTLVMADSHGRD